MSEEKVLHSHSYGRTGQMNTLRKMLAFSAIWAHKVHIWWIIWIVVQLNKHFGGFEREREKQFGGNHLNL
jgi:hypothetical protein